MLFKSDLSIQYDFLLLNFFPEPNLWVHLEASISKIEKRKKELSRNELKKQLRKYRFFFKNKDNFIKINTNYQLNKKLNLIISKIKSITC